MLLTLGGGGRFLSYLVPPGASGSVKQRQIYCLRAHIYSPNVWKRMLQSFKLGLSVQEHLVGLSSVRDVLGSVKPVPQLQCLDSPYMSFYDPGGEYA